MPLPDKRTVLTVQAVFVRLVAPLNGGIVFGFDRDDAFRAKQLVKQLPLLGREIIAGLFQLDQLECSARENQHLVDLLLDFNIGFDGHIHDGGSEAAVVISAQFDIIQ